MENLNENENQLTLSYQKKREAWKKRVGHKTQSRSLGPVKFKVINVPQRVQSLFNLVLFYILCFGFVYCILQTAYKIRSCIYLCILYIWFFVCISCLSAFESHRELFCHWVDWSNWKPNQGSITFQNQFAFEMHNRIVCKFVQTFLAVTRCGRKSVALFVCLFSWLAGFQISNCDRVQVASTVCGMGTHTIVLSI